MISISIIFAGFSCYKIVRYKTDDKNVLLGNQLSLEGLYNSLAMRLSHHKRPEFVPPQGVTLKVEYLRVSLVNSCRMFK